MAERPRILVLDLLESYARERDIDVGLVRRRERHEWVCALRTEHDGDHVTGQGLTAREAIIDALRQAHVELPA
jgi:hypothetical protein